LGYTPPMRGLVLQDLEGEYIQSAGEQIVLRHCRVTIVGYRHYCVKQGGFMGITAWLIARVLDESWVWR
jgi:hypothetical protein